MYSKIYSSVFNFNYHDLLKIILRKTTSKVIQYNEISFSYLVVFQCLSRHQEKIIFFNLILDNQHTNTSKQIIHSTNLNYCCYHDIVLFHIKINPLHIFQVFFIFRNVCLFTNIFQYNYIISGEICSCLTSAL